MKYVSPEYEQQLHDLAETICTPERAARLAQPVLAQVIELYPNPQPPIEPEAA